MWYLFLMILHQYKWLPFAALLLLATDAGCNYAIYQWGYANGVESTRPFEP